MQHFRYVILFFAISFPFLSSAQVRGNGIDIRIGEKIRTSQHKGFHKIIGGDDSGFFAMQSKAGKGRSTYYTYILQHFDEDMNLLREADISFVEKGLKYKFIVQLDGQLYVFLTQRSKDSGEEALFAQEIDKNTLEPTATLQKVAAVNNERKDGYFTHTLSADHSKLLITYASASGRQDRQAFDLFVFDAGLKQLWFKNACLPYPDKLFRTEQYKIDNYGNVHLLSVLFNDKRSTKRNGQADYEYHLLSYRNAGEVEEAYAIRLADKFLTDMQIVVNDRQDVIGGGFYAEQGSYEIEGSYFFTIDGTSNEVVSNSVKEFDKGFIKQLIPASHLSGNSRRFSNSIEQYGFTLNDIVLRDDGSAVLVGEQFLVSSRTEIRRGLLGACTQSGYYYDYTDIILVNAGADGNISWTGKISKHQHSHDDGGRYSSYYLNLLQDTVYFVFNQSTADTSGKDEESCQEITETVIVKVDRDGRQYRQKVEALEELDVSLMPRTGLQAGGTDLVFLAGDKRHNCFIKMRLQPQNLLTSKNE